MMSKIDNKYKCIRLVVTRAGIQTSKKVFETKTSRNSSFWINRFYGMILFIRNSMSQLVNLFFVSSKEENGGFQLIPAIVVFLLALSFQGAIAYIVISSLL